MPRSATAAAWYSCMYGVIVVPTSAIAMSRKSRSARKCGQSAFSATSAQSGWARIIAIGYTRKTSARARNTRSAYRYDPNSTTARIPSAASGTEM